MKGCMVKVQGAGFGVQGLGCLGLVTLDKAAAALTVLPAASGAERMQGLGFRVLDLDLGCRV
jgi:hypothetical protein